MNGIIIQDLTPIKVDEDRCGTSIPVSEWDKALENRCLAVLWKHYPGATWRVDASSERGVVDVFCLNLSSRWGVRWKLGRIYADPDLYWIKMAGGELLERARVARGRFDEDSTKVDWVDGIRPEDQPIRGLVI